MGQHKFYHYDSAKPGIVRMLNVSTNYNAIPVKTEPLKFSILLFLKLGPFAPTQTRCLLVYPDLVTTPKITMLNKMYLTSS